VGYGRAETNGTHFPLHTQPLVDYPDCYRTINVHTTSNRMTRHPHSCTRWSLFAGVQSSESSLLEHGNGDISPVCSFTV